MKTRKQDKSLFRWKMDTMCENCPFATEGPGLTLRQSLHPQRMADITNGLIKGDHFFCHKTTKGTGNGDDLYCAGALAFQTERKIETPYMEVCQMFEGVRESKRTIMKRLEGKRR